MNAPQHAPGDNTSTATSRLHLVQTPHSAHYSPLALWHLLSLDAPTVATLWTWFIAHSCGTHLDWPSLGAVFFAVWMLYAADRLLDARTPADLEERHHFHHRHRTGFLTAITFASACLAILLHKVPAPTLRLYAILATLLAAWLLLVHARGLPAVPSHRLPKELAVGLFFPAAIFIPTVATAPRLRLELLLPAAAFALVCTLNCVFLYAWEHPGPACDAHSTTRWATRHIQPLSITMLVALIAITATSFAFPQALATRPLLACIATLTLLLLLHRRRQRFSPLHLRALADVTLLTPFAFLITR